MISNSLSPSLKGVPIETNETYKSHCIDVMIIKMKIMYIAS